MTVPEGKRQGRKSVPPHELFRARAPIGIGMMYGDPPWVVVLVLAVAALAVVGIVWAAF